MLVKFLSLRIVKQATSHEPFWQIFYKEEACINGKLHAGFDQRWYGDWILDGINVNEDESVEW